MEIKLEGEERIVHHLTECPLDSVSVENNKSALVKNNESVQSNREILNILI